MLYTILGIGSSQSPSHPTSGADQAAALIPNDQLDSLMALIALYPDPLLSQVLVASTYPLEIMQSAAVSGKEPDIVRASDHKDAGASWFEPIGKL